MALPSTIHRATIQLADIDGSRYETLQTTVARHPSETAERLVARLLAYALCFEEGLVFTRGIAAGDEPDLWRKGPDGRVVLWVEVGLPDTERLLKAARHALRVVLVACGSGLPRWLETARPRLARLTNLSIVALDWPFVQQAANKLDRSINWSLTLSGGTLYLSVDRETLEGPLTVLQTPTED